MALQMFMKIDGVAGEAKHFQHKGWCDIQSWNWGMTSTRKLAQTGEGDKTTLNEISVVKFIAADSAAMRLLFAQGKVIPSVELSVIPTVSKREVQTKYVVIRMEDVIIKSIVTGGGMDDDFFKEHVTLLFGRIKFEYTQGGAEATGKGTKFAFAWDVPGNGEWNQPPEAVSA